MYQVPKKVISLEEFKRRVEQKRRSKAIEAVRERAKKLHW